MLRRLACILEGLKNAVVDAVKTLPEDIDDAMRDIILFGVAGGNIKVYNRSRFTFDKLRGQDPRQIHDSLAD